MGLKGVDVLPLLGQEEEEEKVGVEGSQNR